MEQQEYFFGCPYCFQEISILVDPSVQHQNYVEDCEVSCNPIEFNVTISESEIIAFDAKRMDD